MIVCRSYSMAAAHDAGLYIQRTLKFMASVGFVVREFDASRWGLNFGDGEITREQWDVVAVVAEAFISGAGAIPSPVSSDEMLRQLAQSKMIEEFENPVQEVTLPKAGESSETMDG